MSAASRKVLLPRQAFALAALALTEADVLPAGQSVNEQQVEGEDRNLAPMGSEDPILAPQVHPNRDADLQPAMNEGAAAVVQQAGQEGSDDASIASPAAEAAVEAELGIFVLTQSAVVEATAATDPAANADSNTELWASLVEPPYTATDVTNTGAVSGGDHPSQTETVASVVAAKGTAISDLRVNADGLQEVGQPSAADVIDIAEDNTATALTARRARKAAQGSLEGARRALARDAEVEENDAPCKLNGKRKATEDESYESGDEQDELAEDEDGQTAVPNCGVAPKGSPYHYVEQVMRFSSFAWSFTSFYGERDQYLTCSMVKPFVRLEMIHNFQAGRHLPGLPQCAVSWMTHRRAACRIYSPAYMRDELHEPYFEHRMLYCMSVVRTLKFEDVAGMYGRRGFILLVHGLLQARASNLLGDDWAPCVEEVARLLDALARNGDDDYARNKDGDEVEHFDEASTVLEVLTVLDKEATDAVTAILSRRVAELEAMKAEDKQAGKDARTKPAKRAKHRSTPSSGQKLVPKRSLQSPRRTSQEVFVQGSSTGSPSKKSRR